MIKNGVTCVGDISSDGESFAPLDAAGLRAVVYHEVLGASRAGIDGRRVDLHRRFFLNSDTALLRNGVAPHALYSTAPELFSAAATLAATNNAPMAIHVAETPEEREFALQGTGPFKQLLDSFGIDDPFSVIGADPVTTLARYGTLDNIAAIHCNHLTNRDGDTLQHVDATMVYCPGSNHWFGRDDTAHWVTHSPPPVPIALGTDSLASNDVLDMRQEMRWARGINPDLTPATCFAMATVNGAAALRLPPLQGTLRPGAPFDAVTIPFDPADPDPYNSLLHYSAAAGTVWVAGHEIFHNQAFYEDLS
jgi:cytosine/adenosine deaminase-related metal-dependent hydrolase